jgi:hypothetical protein
MVSAFVLRISCNIYIIWFPFSKVITELIDQVCPKTVNKNGAEIPVQPTVFSGDNKTEKMARSAQLALVENGTMRDRLGMLSKLKKYIYHSHCN